MSDRLDFHNHVIPQVDDGSSSIEASLTAIRTMLGQNICHIIASPHLRASLANNIDKGDDYFTRIDTAWDRLLSADIPAGARLYRGFEILLDVPKLELANPLLRLAGSAFVLVEFPFTAVPPHSADALFHIKIQNIYPIVAHPERYVDVQQDSGRVADWLRVGAYLQSNAGSFVGHYGRDAERTAWTLLDAGVVSYVCSDYHATGACHTDAAATLIERKYGGEISDLLFSENPQRILRNEPPLPVQPRARGIASRLKSLVSPKRESPRRDR